MIRSRSALLSLAIVCAGCPSVTPTQAEITAAEVVGDPQTTSYEVQVTGRGFTPSTLEYNLSSGTGSGAAELVLEIFRASDGRTTRSTHVDLVSTRELTAHLTAALDLGTYGVRLVREGQSGKVAELETAFIIRATPDRRDGGELDGGVTTEGDAEVLLEDGAVVYPDAAVFPDAEAPDLGAPDSGLGEFPGNFRYRQEVRLTNTSLGDAPAGITFTVAIPHGMMLSAGQTNADATDIALYYGTVQLPYAWEDRSKVGTDQLVMIAQLPELIPAGAERSRLVPLAIYYGDPQAAVLPTDAVFAFVERFNTALPADWTLRDWTQCLWDRSTEIMTPLPGAYCVTDAAGEQRISLSSPRIAALDANLPLNQVYVLSFYLSGVMGGANDLLYFAVDDNVALYEQTIQLQPTEWTEAPPLVPFTFLDINNAGLRTVLGWQFGAIRQPWTRSVARFRSPVEDPSLHVRYLSIDQADNAATYVAIDDYTVRLALDTELSGQLQPAELR